LDIWGGFAAWPLLSLIAPCSHPPFCHIMAHDNPSPCGPEPAPAIGKSSSGRDTSRHRSTAMASFDSKSVDDDRCRLGSWVKDCPFDQPASTSWGKGETNSPPGGDNAKWRRSADGRPVSSRRTYAAVAFLVILVRRERFIGRCAGEPTKACGVARNLPVFENCVDLFRLDIGRRDHVFPPLLGFVRPSSFGEFGAR